MNGWRDAPHVSKSRTLLSSTLLGTSTLTLSVPGRPPLLQFLGPAEDARGQVLLLPDDARLGRAAATRVGAQRVQQRLAQPPPVAGDHLVAHGGSALNPGLDRALGRAPRLRRASPWRRWPGDLMLPGFVMGGDPGARRARR